MCALPAAGKTKCGKCAMLEGKHPSVFMIFVWNRAGRNNGLKQEAFAGQKNIDPVPPQAVLNVDVLLQEVIAQAKTLHIPVSEHIQPHVRINRRATGRFGACFADRRTGTFQIEISDVLLTARRQVCCQTLAHEVLHTCYGCQNHKKRWQQYAERMNCAYGYAIARTDSPERLGVENKRVVRYLVRCGGCGAEIPRARRSRLVEHPEEFRCAKCGGTLTVERVAEQKS